MNLIRKTLIFLALLASSNALAARGTSAQVHLLIEPIIGYDSIKRTAPNAHTTGMFVYGGRLVLGTFRLALETQYTYGSSSESFITPAETINYSRNAVRGGLRTVVPLSFAVHLLFRGGEQGVREEQTIATAAGTSKNIGKWDMHPYAGTGIQLFLLHSLSFDVEETYIFDGTLETGLGFRLFI